MNTSRLLNMVYRDYAQMTGKKKAEIAADANVSVRTLNRMLAGDTKAGVFTTIRALGFNLRISYEPAYPWMDSAWEKVDKSDSILFLEAFNGEE